MADETSPDGEYTLRHIFPNKDEAKAGAAAKQSALDRAIKHLNLTVLGNPELCAEMLLTVSGVRTKIDGPWRIKTATHTISPDGFKTALSCENPDAKAESGTGSNGGGTTKDEIQKAWEEGSK